MMDKMTRERDLRILRSTLIVFSVGAIVGIGACYLYFALARRYPFLTVGCAMKQILHIYCPGCGGTRAVRALLFGQLGESLRANPIVLWGAGLLAVQYVRTIRALVRRDPACCRIPAWSWISVIVILLVFFVVRNVLLIGFGYDYLGDNLAFWENFRA
ncbi:MAG: DUF2752 domain-containing protein [Clostridia bacterium]|nr:DUF2752 domain-containing protein [Clostridia bacterium]